MQVLQTTQKDFDDQFATLLTRGKMDIDGVSSIVTGIIRNIKGSVTLRGQTLIEKYVNTYLSILL